MIIDARCELAFYSGGYLPAILLVRPQSGAGQTVLSESFRTTPHVKTVEYGDTFGNLCERVLFGPGNVSICFECRVATPDTVDVNTRADFVTIENLPTSLLRYLLPSRYCQSDLLNWLATEITVNVPNGYQQVEAIRLWIKRNVLYQYGTSNTTTSAVDTANYRTGVCRDFTHLGIALCRAINIPARMVVGYCLYLPETDMHAWFEAYVGHRWYTFDATQDHTSGNRIVIAYGRDATDVALVTQFGPLTLEYMNVHVEPAPPPGGTKISY